MITLFRVVDWPDQAGPTDLQRPGSVYRLKDSDIERHFLYLTQMSYLVGWGYLAISSLGLTFWFYYVRNMLYRNMVAC